MLFRSAVHGSLRPFRRVTVPITCRRPRHEGSVGSSSAVVDRRGAGHCMPVRKIIRDREFSDPFLNGHAGLIASIQINQITPLVRVVANRIRGQRSAPIAQPTIIRTAHGCGRSRACPPRNAPIQLTATTKPTHVHLPRGGIGVRSSGATSIFDTDVSRRR